MSKENDYIDLDNLAATYNMDSTHFLKFILDQYTISSNEILDRLDISKQRLSSLKQQGLLSELQMRADQVRDSLKFKKGYDLTPAYKSIDQSHLIINFLRFFDCLAMVDHSITNQSYDAHISGALRAVVDTFENAGKVYILEHAGFDEIESCDDLLEARQRIKKEFETRTQFIAFMKSVELKILGLPKVRAYEEILTTLESMGQNHE
jgi:hypothetical protein